MAAARSRILMKPAAVVSAKSSSGRRTVSVALGVVALTTMLTPLNTSMMAVALADVQRSFGVTTAASAWLLVSFVVTAAVAQPLMGRFADRVGGRPVLLAGLIVVGASGLAAAGARSFEVVVVMRVAQALGTSTAHPAGLALLREARQRGPEDGLIPPSWLGLISATGNVSAALGPVLGGLLVSHRGWPSVFLVNVPVALVAISVTLSLPRPDSSPRAAGSYSFAGPPARFVGRSLFRVYLQQAAVSTVFYSVFFGLPVWLQGGGGRSAAQTGLIMAPLAACSALLTPLAIKMAHRRGCASVLAVGAAALTVGSLGMVGMEEGASRLTLVGLVSFFGLPNAFNNLGLQADLVASAPPAALGTAGGVLQTARFAGAGLAACIVGASFASGTTTAAVHRLGAVLVVLSGAVLAAAIRRLVRAPGFLSRAEPQEVLHDRSA